MAGKPKSYRACIATCYLPPCYLLLLYIMVGIVLVSHSATLAEGVRELIQQMAADAPVALAAGTDNADEPIGTDPLRVRAAIDSVYSDEGVLVLMDLGSAIMSAEAAIEFLDEAQQARVHLCEAPLVEGGLAAAVAAAGGDALEQVMAEARAALPAKLAQLEPVLRLQPEADKPGAPIRPSRRRGHPHPHPAQPARPARPPRRPPRRARAWFRRLGDALPGRTHHRRGQHLAGDDAGRAAGRRVALSRQRAAARRRARRDPDAARQ